MKKIEIKSLSGFPELLPEQQIAFANMMRVIREAYELYGFSPIETPAVERKEVLTSKGGNEKEIYTVSRLLPDKDGNHDTDMALHFDLTVPLARYVAQHKNDLVFPFRRYQIQPVWRGERAQSGRYRQFYQCDIDVIGRGSLDIKYDAEIPSIIAAIFHKLDFGPFTIRLNNRKVLTGYLESMGVAIKHIGIIVDAIDDLEKIGRNKVVQNIISQTSVDVEVAEKIINFLSFRGVVSETIEHLKSFDGATNVLEQGIEELENVTTSMKSFGMSEENFRIDLSIARGLDYYTGTVYETILDNNPELGSVCSGGRYEELASHFTDEKLPGVGISIGLSRLAIQLMKMNILKTDKKTPANVLVTMFGSACADASLSVAAQLRQVDISTEVYMTSEKNPKIGKQLQHAHKKGIEIVIILGEDEVAQDTVAIKNMTTGDQVTVAQSEMIEVISKMLEN